MNQFLEALTRVMPRSENIPDISKIKVPENHSEYLKWQCDNYNHLTGNLNESDGCDCPECLNKGYISIIKDDTIVQRRCRCMTKRTGFLRLKKSGLGELAQRCTFDSYDTPEEWQKRAKSKAMQYVSEDNKKWLFFGGQSGCGKTHLCTAVCVELINLGHDVKYVLWRDLIHYLEGNRFDNEKYNSKIQELQNIDALYIDDFLKTTRRADGRIAPSESELNSAYEIISMRAISGKKTIISSELHISDISALDEATGGRIAKNSNGFQIQVKFDKKRNFRFYGGT